MKIAVRLDDETLRLLDDLAAGKTRSAAIRDAIHFAARLTPLVQRLDRIEKRLLNAPLRQLDTPPVETPDAAEALRRTIAAEPAGFIDDD